MNRVLTDVYASLADGFAASVLYKLLAERDEAVNISHTQMPSWTQHQAFVASRPYAAWYLIERPPHAVGAVYLSRNSEVGIFVFKEHRGKGHGSWAIKEIMKKHPQGRYLANINPRNSNSIKLFEKLGFNHIQNTYAISASLAVPTHYKSDTQAT